MPKTEANSDDEHKRLASIIKAVHADLRKKVRACEYTIRELQICTTIDDDRGHFEDLMRRFPVLGNGDYERVWQQHCEDKAVLSEYADCMQKLAVEHWTKKPQTRIEWCHSVITEYFLGGGMKKALEKDAKRLRQRVEQASSPHGTALTAEQSLFAHHLTCPSPGEGPSQEIVKTDSSEKGTNVASVEDVNAGDVHTGSERSNSGCAAEHTLPEDNDTTSHLSAGHFEGKVRLLDVGSCYNPFQQFPELLPVAIDISPATQTVHQCDFLGLKTTDPADGSPQSLEAYLRSLSSPVRSLPRALFQVVVFSLLLEYLPAPEQRWQCCVKAHELLEDHGLLVIITPDSHSQHRNAPMMRSWKTAIESLGFLRWRYVKLEHLHCMAFRKLPTRMLQNLHKFASRQAGSDDKIQRHTPSADRQNVDQPTVHVSECTSECRVTPDTMLYIPQDLKDTGKEEEDSEEPERREEFEDREGFFHTTDLELPGFISDEDDDD